VSLYDSLYLYLYPPSLDLSRRGKTNKMSALNASASTGMFRVVSSTGLCIHASSSSSSPTAAAPCGSHEQGCAFQPILVSIASSLPTVTRSAHFFSTRLSVSASSWISRSNRSTSKRRLQVQAKKDELSPIRTVPVQVAHELINAGHRYLDVRTPEEYAAGHVEGSINIPYMVKMGPGTFLYPPLTNLFSGDMTGVSVLIKLKF
jgi:hypothetical protein